MIKDVKLYNVIFERATADYHMVGNNIATYENPYPAGSPEALLYDKNRTDNIQWHLEDIIRDPDIDPAEALKIKRHIDHLNQLRTDMVEEFDSMLSHEFGDVKPLPDAGINTESPAWAMDRLSILTLKIWHMREQTERPDADGGHIEKCRRKLAVLKEQREDLTGAIGTLLRDIGAGRKLMKGYRQMKMYNDPATNPVLYGKKE